MTPPTPTTGPTPLNPVTRHVDVPGLGDPRRFGYAHAVAAGGLLFLAGQMGIDTDYRVPSGDFDDQATRTLTNVLAALRAGGTDAAHLVSMTVYLVDMGDSARFFEIRSRLLGDVLVASTTVAVSGLPLPGLLVEVQAVAAVPPP
ncbi:RidA family protein [Actinokineospora inagensis]|uniref:RidA family protein n=1 Tax=Actinokineospora inagensis TaxID=103730 RepID=UPI000417E405|nr:RidA family protein [Actinokineospora inagensis]